MQIKFVRSGGFAGPATSVAGTVQLDEHGGHVNAEGTDYHRELDPREVERLRAAAAPDALATAQAAPAADGVRDGYQYDITVVGDQGNSQSLTVGEAGAAADLRSWMQDEAQKIWRHRLSTRK